jgi:NAD-dependent dihydropyrimidine dehydrogenase PreA subunit
MVIQKRPVYENIFEYLYEHYEFNSPVTPLTKFYKKDINENQYKHLTGPVNPEKTEFKNPAEAAEVLSEFAWAAGADLVGFTQVKENFIFHGIEVKEKFAVVLGVEMDFDLIATAPEPPSGVEVLRGYWRLGGIICKVGEFIRDLGYPATAHHPRSFRGKPPTILHPIAALEAGLGEIGRHGLLITKKFGPRVRVATVTTDLELPQNQRITFGVEEFCQNCRFCIEACEGEAIPENKSEVRCVLKYTIDPYKCLPYFAKFDGCNLCVSECAFNKKPEELEMFVRNLKN